MITLANIESDMIANNLTPFEPTHPGELIRDELEARNLLRLQRAYNMHVAKSDSSLMNRLANIRKIYFHLSGMVYVLPSLEIVSGIIAD